MARRFTPRIYDAPKPLIFALHSFTTGCEPWPSGTHWILPRLLPLPPTPVFRRYFRLAAQSESGNTLIAVDAPPPEKCREFVQVAGLLRDAGVHVPQILAADFDAGFMLVTDLGTTTYLSVLDEKNARPMMRAAIDALIKFPGDIAGRASLPAFDEAFLRREMELMPEWFVREASRPHAGNRRAQGARRDTFQRARAKRAGATAGLHAARTSCRAT